MTPLWVWGVATQPPSSIISRTQQEGPVGLRRHGSKWFVDTSKADPHAFNLTYPTVPHFGLRQPGISGFGPFAPVSFSIWSLVCSLFAPAILRATAPDLRSHVLANL